MLLCFGYSHLWWKICVNCNHFKSPDHPAGMTLEKGDSSGKAAVLPPSESHSVCQKATGCVLCTAHLVLLLLLRPGPPCPPT